MKRISLRKCSASRNHVITSHCCASVVKVLLFCGAPKVDTCELTGVFGKQPVLCIIIILGFGYAHFKAVMEQLQQLPSRERHAPLDYRKESEIFSQMCYIITLVKKPRV